MNLNKEYTDPSKPGAFAGFDGFYKALKKRNSNISREKVQKFLEGQETYTLHKPKLKNFPRKRVRVNGIDDTWQLDLVDMQKFAKENKFYVSDLIMQWVDKLYEIVHIKFSNNPFLKDDNYK